MAKPVSSGLVLVILGIAALTGYLRGRVPGEKLVILVSIGLAAAGLTAAILLAFSTRSAPVGAAATPSPVPDAATYQSALEALFNRLAH